MNYQIVKNIKQLHVNVIVFFLVSLITFSCAKDANEDVINELFFGAEASTTNPPTVSTSQVSNIIKSDATCGGDITSQGGAEVTARGICWNTSPAPTTSNSYTTNGTGTGSFISNIFGLASNTTYYVRAYATNSFGTAYGDDVSFISATYTATVPTNGLVVRYPFNGSSSDVSGNNLHGTPYDVYSTTDRFGNTSSAALFLGASNSWIQVPHNVKLNLGPSFTLSVWVFKESGSRDYVFGKGRDITCGTYAIGTPSINANGSCGTSASNSTELPLNQWVLITGVMDGAAGKLRYFQNGQLIQEVACNSFTSNNMYPLAIGRHVTNIPASETDPWAYPFKGKLDDLLIYNRALTSAEIGQIYNAIE